MSEWKEVKLGEILKLITKGTTPPKGVGFVDKGINYVKSDAIGYDRKLDKSKIVSINEETHQKFKRSHLAENDILFSMAGIYLGKNALVTKDILPANTNQALAILRLNQEKANPIYVSLYLSQQGMIDFVNNISGQSAQPNINFEEIKSIEIKLPPLPEQTAVASILSSLNDKIDLLHRQNATLEKMAETLFRQWFVEEAKEEWENIKVKDVCLVITKGTTPTTFGKSFKENGVNFIKAESLTDEGTFIAKKFAFIDNDTNNLLKRSQIQEGDVLITIAGTIGRIGYVTNDILPANTNQAIGIMRVNRQIINPYFLYCLFNSTEIKNNFDGRVVHAVQPNLSLGEIGDIEFKLPPSEVLTSGTQKIEGLFIKKNKNQTQIRTLTALRDSLLPKLMSGEVKVVL